MEHAGRFRYGNRFTSPGNRIQFTGNLHWTKFVEGTRLYALRAGCLRRLGAKDARRGARNRIAAISDRWTGRRRRDGPAVAGLLRPCARLRNESHVVAGRFPAVGLVGCKTTGASASYTGNRLAAGIDTR